LVVSTSKQGVREERFVVQAHVREQRVREQEPRGRSGVDKRELLAAQLVDAVDARIGANDDLRPITLAALTYGCQDDLTTILIMRQHVSKRRQPANVDLSRTHGFDHRDIRGWHGYFEVQVGRSRQQIRQRLSGGKDLL